MQPLAWMTLGMGLLIVATRVPLAVAPKRTLALFRALIATAGRVRMLAVFVGLLGLGFVATAPGAVPTHPDAAAVLGVLGWIWIGAGAFLMLFPRAYQALGEGFLAVFSDETTLRVLGVLGTLIGLAIVWLAFEIR
jgi:hypothetical protein